MTKITAKIKKNCAVCGTEFTFGERKNIHTCSNACKGVWQTKSKEEKTCAREQCGKTFILGGSKKEKAKKFCSRSCGAIVHNQSRKEWPEEKLAANRAIRRENLYARKAARTPEEKRLYDEKVKLSSRKALETKSLKEYGTSDVDAVHVIRAKESFEESLLSPFDELSQERKRKRVFHEQGGKCGGCKIDQWLGHTITLELEHIDGNNQNNERKNLIGLCPNCHSITPTWRGRNKRGVRLQVTDEQLKEAILCNYSLASALKSVGMTPKGGNYKRANRLKALIEEETKAWQEEEREKSMAGFEPAVMYFYKEG